MDSYRAHDQLDADPSFVCQMTETPDMSRSKCSYADRYLGIRAPRCGCSACKAVWEERCRQQADLIARRVRQEWTLCTCGGYHAPGDLACDPMPANAD
jgi:hypothetical protein